MPEYEGLVSSLDAACTMLCYCSVAFIPPCNNVSSRVLNFGPRPAAIHRGVGAAG